MTRPALNQYLLNLAHVVATRATCAKRSVGSVVADKRGRIIAAGYNGPPSGFPHCTDTPCIGAVAAAAPASYSFCNSIHSEANALALAGERARGGMLAITTSPCKACALLIINAGISKIICGEQNRLFTDREAHGISPQDLLVQAKIEVEFL